MHTFPCTSAILRYLKSFQLLCTNLGKDGTGTGWLGSGSTAVNGREAAGGQQMNYMKDTLAGRLSEPVGAEKLRLKWGIEERAELWHWSELTWSKQVLRISCYCHQCLILALFNCHCKGVGKWSSWLAQACMLNVGWSICWWQVIIGLATTHPVLGASDNKGCAKVRWRREKGKNQRR